MPTTISWSLQDSTALHETVYYVYCIRCYEYVSNWYQFCHCLILVRHKTTNCQLVISEELFWVSFLESLLEQKYSVQRFPIEQLNCVTISHLVSINISVLSLISHRREIDVAVRVIFFALLVVCYLRSILSIAICDFRILSFFVGAYVVTWNGALPGYRNRQYSTKFPWLSFRAFAVNVL